MRYSNHKLRDENYSFLAIRYFQMLAYDYCSTFFNKHRDDDVACQTEHLLNFIDNTDNPEIEWELCDKLFSRWLSEVLSYAPQVVNSDEHGMLARILKFVMILFHVMVPALISIVSDSQTNYLVPYLRKNSNG